MIKTRVFLLFVILLLSTVNCFCDDAKEKMLAFIDDNETQLIGISVKRNAERAVKRFFDEL